MIDALQKRGIEPLESMMMHVGGWPMAMEEQEWDEDENNWRRIEDYYFLIGGKHVFYNFDAPPYKDKDAEFEYIGV